jgi:hypothetical protein
MADVSVEFGAKDTGLEQTLKTVQDELARLNDEVKSGELSFDELQSTMRKVAQAEKLEQQLQAIADETRGAGDAASDAAPEIDDAGDSMDEMGNSATGAGQKSEMGFAQMAAAVAAGQAAVELAMGAIKGAIDAVTGTFGKFSEAIEKGAELDILSTRTGVASGELARLGRALDNTGASADMLGPVFDRMNRAIAGGGEEGGKASAALAKIGITVEELKALSPDEQFEKIGRALSGVTDFSERADIAMDIFGRGSGTRLLRLFEDFPGAMAQADRQLGLFPSIMNEVSRSFEAISTETKAAQQKMVEFATGILSRVTPAIEAIATGLASIDAAALGQQLADAFVGGEKAMKGFQSALDAIKIGEFRLAFDLVFESIKLQAMQTSNELRGRLTAAFTTATKAISEIFGPGSGFATATIDSISLIGMLGAKAFAEAFIRVTPAVREMLVAPLKSFIDLIPGLAPAFELGFAAGEKASDKAIAAMKASLGGWENEISEQTQTANQSVLNFLDNAKNAVKEIPKTFAEEYAAIPKVFDDLTAQQAKVAALQDQITGKVAETNTEINEGVDEQGAAAEELRAQINEQNARRLATVQLQNDLNEAIASGNEKEAERLKALIEDEKAMEKIAKLTKEFAEFLPEEEAEILAANLVNSERAAAAATVNANNLNKALKGAEDPAKTVREQVEAIAQAKLDASPERMRERTKEAREELKKMGDFIGEDLSRMRLEDILAKLGLDPENFETTNEKLSAVEGAIKKLGDADPADITPEVDELGVNDRLKKVQEYLSGLKKPDATPEINQQTFEDRIEAAKRTLEQLEDVKVNVEPVFDPESFQKQIDVAVQSSKGTEHLSHIEKLTEGVKDLLNKIEGKLPLQALAY